MESFVTFVACIVCGVYLVISLYIVILTVKNMTCNDSNNDDRSIALYMKCALYIIIVSFSLVLISLVFLYIIIFTKIFEPESIIVDSILIGVFVFYLFGRYGMILLFIGRLYYGFIGSIAEISLKQFLVLIIFYGVVVVSFVTLYCLAKYYSDNLGFALVIAIIIYGLSDILINIIMLTMFVKRLKYFKNNSVIDEQHKLYNTLIRKYTYLSFITVLSTLVSFILIAPFAKNAEGISINYQITTMIFGLDAVINMFCAYLTMVFAKNKYIKYCMVMESFCCTLACK